MAHMVWGGGWLGELGVLDFAGGTLVHICSGATASALSIYLSYPLFRSNKVSHAYSVTPGITPATEYLGPIAGLDHNLELMVSI
jgi:hypothetical protein